MVHTTVNTGIDTLTNWHTSSSGDKRGSTDNHYKDWLNDMRVSFFETADYGLDWAGGGSGVDVETTFPGSPSSGVDFIRYNTATSQLRLYSYDGTNWVVVGNENRQNFFNGTFKESIDALISSNGSTITLSLEQSGGGDLTMRFSDGETVLDCTPASTISLTPGTATVPQLNYVYILKSDKILTVSTTGFPSTEHIHVAVMYVQTAALVQSDGAMINQNWNDHQMSTTNQGHLVHITKWIRRNSVIYVSGVDGNSVTTDDYLDITTGPDAVHFVAQAGVVAQLHEHTVSAVDTSGSDDIHVVNDPTTPFVQINELIAGITKLSDSTAIGNNKYFNLVFWGVANKSGTHSPTMVNLPSKQYTSLVDAQNDVDGGDTFTIPAAFSIETSTGFLICRLTIQLTGSTWVYHSTTDLRGTTPQTASGGGTGGAGSDTTAIHDNQLAEISAIANKATPIGADFLLIEDSAASDAKKHITITNLEAILTHNNLAGIDAGDVNHLTDAQVTALHAEVNPFPSGFYFVGASTFTTSASQTDVFSDGNKDYHQYTGASGWMHSSDNPMPSKMVINGVTKYLKITVADVHWWQNGATDDLSRVIVKRQEDDGTVDTVHDDGTDRGSAGTNNYAYPLSSNNTATATTLGFSIIIYSTAHSPASNWKLTGVRFTYEYA